MKIIGMEYLGKTEHQNLKDQIKECEERMVKLLDSSKTLLEKAIQLQKYIIKCRERMAEIEEKNGERSREKTKI